ncbi:hypothetical protein DRO61_09065 [Candidatus Bathyarchaeota archaeon]|jgi:hypothetical protein|nr:MAG: hypothetical protein DRO61_09065 [Candidatus Bathyarchaeota archaeon]
MASLTFTVSTTRSNRRQQGGNRRPQKTFCKVCFDAGKTEQEYTSHFLKDRPGPNGKVVCPTLLLTECRYCHEHGHFKSHCPVLEERKRDKVRITKERGADRRQKFESGNWMTAAVSKQLDEAVAATKMQSKVSVPVQKFTSQSAFAALDSDDEEEVESYTRGPSTAVARAPQGAWNTKFSIQTATMPTTKPATKPATIPASIPLTTFWNEVKKSANLSRKAEIVAELAELNAELQEETQKSSGAWADAGDIDDLETSIEALEEELAGL